MHINMMARVAALAVLMVSVGCGEKEDYKERYLKLQEQHETEIARLQQQHKEERTGYEQKLSSYKKDLTALTKRLDAAKEPLDDMKRAGGASPEALVAGGEKDGQEGAVQPGEALGAAVDVAGFAQSPSGEADDILEWFAWNYESFVDEGMREEFRKDFSDYIAGLREQAADEQVPAKKEDMLSSLQERINTTTDESERELLELRVEEIRNASEEDLDGILDYYNRLDNIEELNHLMNKYNISREELREAGITPPPRGNWGPDVKEIAYNLNNFVNDYEPLTDAGQREQYREDFNNYINNLTTQQTDEQVFQRRDQMIADLEDRYETASERDKRRLERRIQRLQDSDADRMRRRIQIERLVELNQLAEKYDIPSRELQQSGVWLFRGRRSRR